MTKYLSGLVLSLISFLAYAAVSEDAPPPAPVPADASPLAMVVVALIFVGGIAWFFWFIWAKERDRKRQEGESS